MKRAKKDIPKGMIQYKKVGGGSFLLTIEGKRVHIKPNQIFVCHPEDIPVAFHDVLIPLSGIEKANQGLERGGFYDVVDKMGKIQNETGLREDKAKELIESLKA